MRTVKIFKLMENAAGKESSHNREGDSATMKRTIICVVIVVLCASGSFARSTRTKRPSGVSQVSAADMALARKRWPAFIAAFRAAVNKRDRVALREMIAIPFNTQEGILNSAEEVFKLLDREKWWGQLKKETAPGARFPSGGRTTMPQRCTRGIFCFEFGSDGRWRLSAQVEND